MSGWRLPSHLRTGSEEQAAVCHVYRAAGGIVYSTTDARTKRASGRRAKGDKGLSDLIVVWPNRRILLFHESKAGDGRLTEDQALFGQRVKGLMVDFHWGDADAAKAWLRSR